MNIIITVQNTGRNFIMYENNYQYEENMSREVSNEDIKKNLYP